MGEIIARNMLSSLKLLIKLLLLHPVGCLYYCNYNYIEELCNVLLRSGVADDFVLLEDVSTLEDETTMFRNVEIRLPIDALSYRRRKTFSLKTIILTWIIVRRQQQLTVYYNINCGPGSSVGIATGYGLDGPGIESQWRRDFRTYPNRPWGPPSLLYNGYRVFPRG